nr:GFA family protein [uncultured Pseudomonas sp.]
MYTGSCLCAGVQFRIDAQLEPIQLCHCSQCRKAQGGPFASNIPVNLADFQLLSGAELLSAFASSPGKQRLFCRRCGSPVYSRKDSLPGVLRIRAGLINESLASRPIAHCHTASKANWWSIDDDLPQFDEGYIPPVPQSPQA